MMESSWKATRNKLSTERQTMILFNIKAFLTLLLLFVWTVCAFAVAAPVVTSVTPSTNSVFVTWHTAGVFPSPNRANGYYVITYGNAQGSTTVTTANTLINGINVQGLAQGTTYGFSVILVIPSTGQSSSSSPTLYATTGTISTPTPGFPPTPTPTATPISTPPTPTPSPTAVPTPTPNPSAQGANPPSIPLSPPSYVTDCPNLAFSDTFNEGSNFQSELSQSGPITPPVKWITNKPDGLDFGGYYQPYNDGFTYKTDSGHLILKMHNYFQNPSEAGDGNWYTGAIASAAWKNQTGGGATTGFLAKAPCYFEVAVWIPELTSCDVPNAAGLWPSISLYTDPQLSSGVGENMELDLLEAYSIDFTVSHYSWHIWGPSGQLSAGGVSPVTPDISQGWHVYGIWIDTGTITMYRDGLQVFSFANPGGVGLEPFYIMLANGYGGGWTVSLTPSQLYNMHVAYVGCWTGP
jgi:hypothetical protein